LRSKLYTNLVMPRVSVIIPTYNRQELLRAALNSVLRQTFHDFEVVVVDDGSTDKTREVCGSYPEVKYLPLAHSGLPATARNAALAVAAGEYIAFLDSDDEWMENKLSVQVELMDRNPALGLVCSNATVIGGPSRKLYLTAGQGQSGSVFMTLLLDNFVITSTAMVRRSVMESVGRFSEEPVLRVAEDYDLWLRIAAVSEVVFIADALAAYRRSSGSVSQQQDGALHWMGILRILERIKRMPGLGADARRAVDERIFTCHAMLCDSYAMRRKYAAFSLAWMKLFSRNPLGGFAYLRQTASKIYRRKPEALTTSNDPESLRLHLGCGDRYLEGYVNIDLPASSHSVQSGRTPDIHADITRLQYADGTVDEIRLHHVFEHFDRPTALRLLIQWHLWLRPGGKLIIETPDLMGSLSSLLDSSGPDVQFRTLRHLFGSHEAEWAVHKDGWYLEKFKIHMEELGFTLVSVETSEWQGTHNITVTGEKTAPGKSKDDLLRGSERLLRMCLVDDSRSELRMLEVWMHQVRSGLDREV
jgi:glycosyltransferase involved in cell wall biosynthesis/predicted SAM-dependent methyltransferase